MHTNLWDETHTDSDSDGDGVDATASTMDSSSEPASEQSPLDAAIEASSWSRDDIDLALNVLQTVMLAVWLFLALQDD